MKKIVTAVLVLSTGLLLTAGCGGGASQTPSPTTSSPGGASGTQNTKAAGSAVSIKDFAFDPATLDVSKGATVKWTNNDQAPHQIYSDDGSIKGSVMNLGDTFTFTFKKAGTVSYFCNLHKQMTGKVVVK